MLKRFYTAVVHRRRAVLAAFVLAAVLSVFASRAVQVDYDINDYLPPDSPSTLALEQMNSAFTGGIPNMRVMVRDVTVPEALDYKEKLAAIDGVEAVTWLDDSLDVTVPLQMQDTATVETYYKDNCALFTVTVEDAKRLEAVAAIQDLIGEDNALAGTAVSTAVATNSTVTEVAKIAAIAVVYVLFILILTTDSWVEPLLVLAGLGAAILHQQRHQPDVRHHFLCDQRRRQHPAAGRVTGLLGVPHPPLCRVQGRAPGRQRGGLHGGGPVQIHRVHPVQRPDHGHRLSGAGAHAVPDRPGPGPCAGQGRGAEPCHRVHLHAGADAGVLPVDG